MSLDPTPAHPYDSLHSFKNTFAESCGSQWSIECSPFSDTFWDLDCLVHDSPSPCLPSCPINCPCSSPLDLTPMADSCVPVPGVMLSTHVMHPKLVNTLKSFMTPPSPTFSDQSGGLGSSGISGISEASSEERSNGSGRRCGDQFCPCHYLESERAEVMADDDDSAVVSVDLIQNRRPFKCAFAGCNKTFKNPQTMKMHHKTHYSEHSSYRLMDAHAHVLSLRAGHNKKIPSRCPVCRKTFVGLYELRRHFGRKHSVGEKTFGCKKCTKRFYIEVDLRDHEKLCGEPIECKCGMKFAFKCNLVAHKKGHPDCQDPPSEETQIKKGAHNTSQQQTRASRSRNASSALAPATVKGSRSPKVTNFRMLLPPRVPQWAFEVIPWSPSSEESSVSSEEFPVFFEAKKKFPVFFEGKKQFPVPGFSSKDLMNFSSECSYSTTTTNGSSYSTTTTNSNSYSTTTTNGSSPLSSRSAPGILFGSNYSP